ncbi:MAG: hypothetical protein H6625_01945 [Bdellovibrionaceae bacterium]|nr:hypothetical protein [Pseudobdellovibrionaceae bacterium]
MNSHHRLLFVLLSVSFLLVNCSEKNASTSATPSFTNIYNNVLSQSCVGCHAPGGDAYDNDGVLLNFSTQTTSYSSLTSLNVTGASSIGTCGGIPIVGNTPETSYLVGVLFDDYHQNNFAGVSGCTPYSVHLSNQNLSASEKSEIINWITAGASNN